MSEACEVLEGMCDHLMETFTAAEEKAVIEGRDRGEDEDEEGGGGEDHQMEEID